MGIKVYFMKMTEVHHCFEEKEPGHLYKIGMFAQMNHSIALHIIWSRPIRMKIFLLKYVRLLQKKEDSELVKFKEFPEILAACIYHKGSYNDFPCTYAVVLKFIEENGYEICGNIRESYIDGVWNKESEKDWLSQIEIFVRAV